MLRVRVLLTLAALVPLTRAAAAQPVDPYAPVARDPKPARPAAPPRANAPVRPGATAPPTSNAPSTTSGTAAPVQPSAPSATPPPPAPAGMPARAPADAPLDPYNAPFGAAQPAAQDPALAERVAAALVTRAQELLDSLDPKVFLDAKQLAVEALVQSPHGASSEHARTIIRTVNRQLGIPEDAPRPPTPPAPKDDVDRTPIQDPTAASSSPSPALEGGSATQTRIAASVHGGLYAGLLGTTIGSFFSSDAPAKGAVPVGLGFAVAGALALPRLTDHLGWDERQIRTVGAATVWGGALGGLFADIAKTEHTSAREVLVGASVGATVAGAAGYWYTRTSELTRGDVALIDTLAGMGAAGGLTLGMVMQPAETEAYSVNAVLGIAGGVVVGAVMAPSWNTTPRRMLRVAGLSAAGGAVPFLLYAAIRDDGSTADERVTGGLSTAGLLGGALLGAFLTRGMDDGLDTLDGKVRPADADAPVALVGRSSSGRWGVGGLGLAPLSPALAPQRGLAVQLVGARF